MATYDPASVRTAESVTATDSTDKIMAGLTEVSPVMVKIDSAASWDLVAAQGASNKIRVLALWFTVFADTTVKFQSGASVDLCGAATIKAGGGLVLPYNPKGWFETAANAKLNVVLGTGVQTSGSLVYIVVT